MCSLAIFHRIKANLHPIYTQERKAFCHASLSFLIFRKKKCTILAAQFSRVCTTLATGFSHTHERKNNYKKYHRSNSRKNRCLALRTWLLYTCIVCLSRHLQNNLGRNCTGEEDPKHSNFTINLRRPRNLAFGLLQSKRRSANATRQGKHFDQNLPRAVTHVAGYID